MLDAIFPEARFMPTLDITLQALIRAIYGWLLLATLVQTLPQARRFFLSERWGGYAESRPDVDILHNPVALPVVLLVWITCAVLLIAGVATVPAALVNLLLCRYYFIQMRWRGVLRGMGAPGFLAYWMAAAVFFLEYARRHDPQQLGLVALVFQVDFALIMLSAGLYKLSAGYARNHGMELGMANPEWGYWWRFYQRMNPGHRVFRALNHLAWGTEIVAALLMLAPRTRLAGALLIMGSFVFIATQIRLAWLCEMVITAALLFVASGTPAALWLRSVMGAPTVPAAGQVPQLLSIALSVGLWTYLGLLPLAHAGLFYNFFGKKRLPLPLQSALERYTNFFGIIIWRVFSADHTNFCIFVHRKDPDGTRTLVSTYDRPGRFWHVGECIAITSVFTTLKYYPSNSSLFRERLLRYARTVRVPSGATIVFEYLSLVKEADRFAMRCVAEYEVNPETEAIVERVLVPEMSVRAALPGSPVHEGSRPGSYAPA